MVRVVAAGLALAGVLAAGATAAPRPGETQRASVTHDGSPADGGSGFPAVSADGRHVAFVSEARNIVPGGSWIDVFVRDLRDGVTDVVSVADDGTRGDGLSLFPALSADGRYVAFSSSAMNLVPDDTTGAVDIFVRDRVTETTERVSLSSGGAQANASSEWPAISADGRYVAFQSTASNLAPGDTNGVTDVFVHDRATRTTERVSVAGDGSQGNGHSTLPALGADGRYVAFQSVASNLVPGDTNGAADVFVHDRETGATERVSVASDGTQASSGSTVASISGDGRFVAFQSAAANLVPKDDNGSSDVFVHDRETGATERVSVSPSGGQANAPAGLPRIGADGRFVVFESRADNLVSGDASGQFGYQVFVHDRVGRRTELASLAADGAQATASAGWPGISGDGRVVVFESAAANLPPAAQDGIWGAFARDRGPVAGAGRVSLVATGDAVTVSGWATFDAVVLAEAAGTPDPQAAQLGADLRRAQVVYRPDEEDLLVRLTLDGLVGVRGGAQQVGLVVLHRPAVAAAPGVLYGVAFEVGGVRYEARLSLAGATPPPASPLVTLHRCDGVCTEVARLAGSIGTTGEEALIALPLQLVGAGPGATVTGLRAFTAVGEPATGPLTTLDEIALPDAAVASVQAALGIAPAQVPQQGVEFDTPVSLSPDGTFQASADAAGLPPGEHRVWVLACLGGACGAAAAPLTVE